MKTLQLTLLAALLSSSEASVSFEWNPEEKEVKQYLLSNGETGNLYQTEIYAGSEKAGLRATLDTTTAWTVIKTSTNESSSYYNHSSSTTAYQVFKNPFTKTHPVEYNFSTTGMQVHGFEFIEDLSLIDEMKASKLHLVVADKFETYKATEYAQGIIGLAPLTEESKPRSFVESQFKTGLLQDKVVGMNFQDPLQDWFKPTVTWGYFETSAIVNGADGLTALPNLGINFWEVAVSSMSYGGDEFIGNSTLGLIDTSDSFIKVGSKIFENLFSKLKEDDHSISLKKSHGRTYLKSSLPCYTIKDKIQDLKFVLGDAELTIQPEGFIFPDPEENFRCALAIEKDEESKGKIRLGTTFLRNFYVGLDFGKNEVLIGGKVDCHRSSVLIKHKQKLPRDESGSVLDFKPPINRRSSKMAVPSKDALNVEWCKEHPAHSWLGIIVLASRRGAPLLDMWTCQVKADFSVIWTIVSPWKDWKLIVGS